MDRTPRFIFGHYELSDLKVNKSKGQLNFKRMKESKLPAVLRYIGITLCIACCTLPLLGAVLGIGALTAFAKYFESGAMITLVIAIVVTGVYFYQRKKTPACDINCGSKKNLE
jgi:hypothetical protein